MSDQPDVTASIREKAQMLADSIRPAEPAPPVVTEPAVEERPRTPRPDPTQGAVSSTVVNEQDLSVLERIKRKSAPPTWPPAA